MRFLGLALIWFLSWFGRPLPRDRTRVAPTTAHNTQIVSDQPELPHTQQAGATNTPRHDPTSAELAVATATLAPPGKPVCRRQGLIHPRTGLWVRKITSMFWIICVWQKAPFGRCQ